jgi:chorismate-pyruvate lyase
MIREALPAALPVTQAPSDVLFTRQYRIDIEGQPVMVVAEWFLGGLSRFLR